MNSKLETLIKNKEVIIGYSALALGVIGLGTYVYKLIKRKKELEDNLEQSVEETKELEQYYDNFFETLENEYRNEMEHLIQENQEMIKYIEDVNKEYNYEEDEWEDSPAMQEERAKYQLIQGEQPEDHEEVVRMIEKRKQLRKKTNIFDVNPVLLPNEEFDPKTLEEKEEYEMNYHPDSQEALNAYQNMLLSSYSDETEEFIEDCISKYKFDVAVDNPDFVIDTVRQLFDIEIADYLASDSNIIETIKYNRKEYFGENSIHNDTATLAEFFIYFADKFADDVENGSAVALLNQLLYNSYIFVNASNKEAINEITRDVMSHHFYNEDGNTIFGLNYDTLVDRSQNGRYETQYTLFITKVLNDI